MKDLDSLVWKFLQDDRFIKWVYAPDEETIAYWKKWMEENPDASTPLFKAREIARDLAYTERPDDVQELADNIWAGIQTSLGKTTGRTPALQPAGETAREGQELVRSLPARRRKLIGYWAAACLLAFAGIGTAYHYYRSPVALMPAGNEVISHLVQHDLQRTNLSALSQQVYLVDGSKITLQPGAGIRHAVFLQKDKREVYLEGNAFFEIAKDADRPFYVYTKDLVVRVLGTSFKVITNKDNGDVAVLVQTGKVSVFKKTSPTRQQLILEPNQQALYKAQTRDLVQSVVDKKDLAMDQNGGLTPGISFNFEEAPVVEIFKKLETAYGVPIRYDQKTFSACVLTTSLADETFEEKVKIICAAIGATYQIGPDGVLVEGKPCK